MNIADGIMRRTVTGLVAGALLVAKLVAPAWAQSDTAQDSAAAAIRGRLEQWTRDFNAGREDAVCDLFSREAISDYRGHPERTYAEICGLLRRSLADPSRTYRYRLDIREILVFGDVAAVRLTWTIGIAPLDVTLVEPGLYIFRKEADGQWRIIRYMAYEAP